MNLELWQVHDDPAGLYIEERCWALVWAPSEHDAKLLAATVYEGDVRDLSENGIEKHFHAEPVDKANTAYDYAPLLPGVERCYEVMRLVGWQEESEPRCDSCGLAAMGMEKYYVCRECYQCRECGCECTDGETTECTHGVPLGGCCAECRKIAESMP